MSGIDVLMSGIDVWYRRDVLMSGIDILMSGIDEWMSGIAVLMSDIDRSILEMQRGGCEHFFQPNLLSPQTWQHDVTVRGLTNWRTHQSRILAETL